ncbi:MAG: cellobiose phosphorylase [Candidatus Cellulosilyticum pullistercoris]|uniref:Cellobiose phosphorylase n=1 Tax=Candidatus Cellulosilyticum pullistercoris TaxID=2838521 RepID=A0A9E2KCW6_9FIRM|nr:cellobiose phosphorylase [Candidatus Cellulosilyticum pullistercoris]
MSKYTYIDRKGTFKIIDPERNSYSYFPLANEKGVMSSVTPFLNGDCKMGQNTFLLAPVSSEDLHNNKSSRNFWVTIESRGIWSATGVSPMAMAALFSDKKEETELEAGVMWHKVTRESKALGIKSEIISFVPASEDTVELMKVTIINTSEEEMVISPTAAIPLYARSADNLRDHRHVTSLLHRIKTTDYSIVVNPTLTFDERGHKKNTIVYGMSGSEAQGQKPIGYFPIVENYIGEGGSFEVPEAIMCQKSPDVYAGSELEGYEAMGGVVFEKTLLRPQESKAYILVLGFGDNEDHFEEMAKKYLSEVAVDEALKTTQAYWDKKINVSYQTGDEEFDNWMYWVNFQPMLRRIYGCSFLPHHDYGKGGRGWRDLWQDCLALLVMDPSGVRSMLLDNFGGVRIDGTNATIIGTKQGEFIADRNNITRVWMDHGAWPFLTTNLYIQQSGDIKFLLEKQNYFKDLQVDRGTDKDERWSPSKGNSLKQSNQMVYQGTILEHLLVQHLTAFYDVGEHNHLRLHGADWNDGLDMADEKGESVAFSALYAGNMREIANLLRILKEKEQEEKVTLAEELNLLMGTDVVVFEDVSKKNTILQTYCKRVKYGVTGHQVEIELETLITDLEAKADWMMQHIRKEEWLTDQSGYSWYNGYYDNHGRRVEGDHEKGTRMMLTSQVFTIMNKVATDQQVIDIVKAADQYLYDPSVGGYKLNTNFNEVKTDLGRMFGFAYGHKENGAVFCHMATMYANALYQRGFSHEGFKVINTLYKHCSDFEKSRIFPGVPEYINGKGRGMYHYLTGAASWLMLTVITEMFGIKGKLGDLYFEPKLLLDQFNQDDKATIHLVFAGKKLKIIYSNPHKKQVGTYSIDKIEMGNKLYNINQSSIKREDIESLAPLVEHTIYVHLI